MDLPYVWKEYPRTLHRPDGTTCVVVNDDAKADALADGWALVPFVDLTGNRFDAPVAQDDHDLPSSWAASQPRKKKGR